MTADHFRDYLNIIGRYPLLTPEQEIQLSRQVHRMLALREQSTPLTKKEEREVKIGKRAKDTIINSNLRLVVHIAKKYTVRLRYNGLELMDLIQEGAIGLDRAAEKFDGTKGYRFTTYAYWWIRQAMSRAIETKERLIRLPSKALQIINNVGRIRNEFMQENGRYPTTAELAKALEIDPDELLMLVSRGATHMSLDKLMLEEDGTPLLNVIAGDDDNVVDLADEYGEQLKLAFFSLSKAERDIIASQFEVYGAKHKTLSSLGIEQGVTRERVRQRMTMAQRKLRILINS